MKQEKRNISAKTRAGASFSWMLLPLLTFLLFAFAIFVERVGFQVHGQQNNLPYLPPVDQTTFTPVVHENDCLIITDQDQGDDSSLTDTLTSIIKETKFHCDSVAASDLNAEWISGHALFVITFYDLDLIKDQIDPLFDKVSTGGGVLFAIRPDPGITYQAMYRKLGIVSKADRFVHANGINFVKDLLIGGKNTGTSFSFFTHNSLPVELDDTVDVFVTSADEHPIPLVWKAEYGEGNVVVINSDQFTRSDSAGFLLSAFGLTKEIFVYPVINSWAFYLDQFPGPLNATETLSIKEQFGRDDKSFFVNVWWTDILAAAKKYDLRPTGLLIESFTDKPIAPFPHEGDEEDFEFLTASIYQNDGEVSLIGYNNTPYCDALLRNDQTDYQRTGLSSAIAFSTHLIAKSSSSLHSIAPPADEGCLQLTSSAMLEENINTVIVRPTNSEEATNIGSLYQEKEEGLITVPLDPVGYEMSEKEEWRLLNLATSKFAISNSVSPYDVIQIGAPEWTELRGNLDDQLLWIRSSFPRMRATTASDAAKATQRYARADIQSYEHDNVIEISIEHFYDEAWLIVVTDKEPAEVTGADYTHMNGTRLLLRAFEPIVHISWED